MDTTKIPLPKLGVDLLSHETALARGAVRRAENVDLDRSGAFSRRKGFRLLKSDSLIRSLHYLQSRRQILVAYDDELLLCRNDLSVVSTYPLAGPVDVNEANGNVYVCGRSGCAYLRGVEQEFRPVGVRPPEVIPQMSPHVSGSYAPGRYAMAISAVNDLGEESPSVFIGSIELPEGGGVQLTGLPVELGLSYRIYITPTDGDTLYLAEEIPAAFSTFVLGRTPDGKQRLTQHLAPLPGGHFIRQHAGRMYLAHRDCVVFSEAMRPHLMRKGHNFVQFVGEIRLLEPVLGGIYVGDDRGVWFLEGNDPTQFRLNFITPDRAVFGSGMLTQGAYFDPKKSGGASEVAVWLSESGHYLGVPGGSAIPLNAARVKFSPELRGRSSLVMRDGRKQVVTVITRHTTHGFAVDSVIE